MKMNIHNNLIIRIQTLIFTTSILVGCDILDQTPESFLSAENFYLNGNDAEAAVNAAYFELNNLYIPSPVFVLDLASDDMVNRTGINAAQYIELAQHTFTSSNTNLDVFWSTSYACIKNCNAVLENVPGIENIEETLKERVIGEAKFIRALTYFNLVRSFGDVPLVTTVSTTIEGLEVIRDPEPEVYSFIVQDLSEAIEMLPESYSGDNAGRATWGAAKSLLAKVYMTLGDFAQATTQLQDVRNSGIYELEPVFSNLFKVDNENGIESIFEIQFIDDGNATAAPGSAMPPLILPRGGKIGTGPAFATLFPRQDLIDSYDQTNDERFAASYFNYWVNESGDTVTFDDPVYHFRKYFDESVNLVRPAFADNTNNVYVLRYADVLLMLAESINEVSGPNAQAYDPLNRLKSATHATNNGMGWVNPTGAFNTAYVYDLNGNLEALARNSTEPDMDVLDYAYEGNKLLAVTDLGDISTGFVDGNPDGNDYAYDANGNATQDLNNGITSITYNYLNLPEIETKDGGGYVKHIYDAKGVKLAQETYDENDVLQSRSVYIGEFVYQDDELKSIQHAEGQIVPDEIDGGWEYRYDLKDQVGNTRVTFTTKPKTFDFAASFESENATEEEAYYYNLAETRVTFNSADAGSDGGNEVTRVNSTQPMGAGVALFVVPGDTLDMEVYGYYEGGSGYSTQSGLSTMIAAIAGGFGGATGAGATEAQQATYDAFDNALSGIGLIGTSNDNVPAAFLNYILFDENMVMYQNGFVQISTAANGSHELIGLEDILVEKEGLAYVWVSNESASSNWVFFDDMNVTIHEGAVIQREDYYPLGLSYNGFKRYEPDYDGTYENAGKKDLGFRQYDPAIGRFHVIDPLAELQLTESPYQYAGNNPVNNVDALGLIQWPKFLLKAGAALINTFTNKTATVVPKNGKLVVEVKGGGRSQKGKRGRDSRSKKKDDQKNDSGGSNENNTADTSGDSSGNDSGSSNNNNTTTASNSQQNNEESQNDPMESFGKREQTFAPTLRNRNNNTNVGINRTPRFNPSPVDRKGIEQQTALTSDNPTQLAKWHREATNATDREQLRQDLYSNLRPLEAIALESLTLLGRDNDPAAASLKNRIAVLGNEKSFEDDGGSDPRAVQEVLDAIKDANANGDATVDLTALKKQYRSTAHRNRKIKINGKDVDISIVFGFGDIVIDPDQNNPGTNNGRVTYDFDKGDGDMGVKIYINSGSEEDLENYLGINTARQILEDNDPLTIAQIQEVRQKLESMTDEQEKKELYQLLQKKIEYANQRITFSGYRYTSNKKKSNIEDYMCNVTVLGRCLELLGIGKSETQGTLGADYDANKPYGHLLEMVREKSYKKKARTHFKTRAKLADLLGASQKYTDGSVIEETKTWFDSNIKNELEAGKGVIISFGGHLVRLEEITDTGLVVDDPFGTFSDFKKRYEKRKGNWESTNTKDDANSNVGDSITWPWTDIQKGEISYIEIYSKKNN